MINIKPIVWVKKEVDVTGTIYYDALLNDVQMCSIHEYDDNTGKYIIHYHGHITKLHGSVKNTHYSLEEAKEIAEVKITEAVLNLLDMRDYKIKKLLNE